MSDSVAPSRHFMSNHGVPSELATSFEHFHDLWFAMIVER